LIIDPWPDNRPVTTATSAHPKDGDRAYEAVSLQLVEHIVDRHRVPGAGVHDLLEAGPDSLPVDVYLVVDEAVRGLRLQVLRI